MNQSRLRISSSFWQRLISSSDLDGIVDEPLGSGKCTDHDDPRRQSLPDSHEAEFLQGLAGGGSLDSVHLRHHSVGWVRHDGAENTSNVTGSKRHYKLFALAALIAGLWYYVPDGRINNQLIIWLKKKNYP